MTEQITLTEFAQVKLASYYGKWVVETPYTANPFRSVSRATRSHIRRQQGIAPRLFETEAAARKAALTEYRRREKAGKLPVKTACTFKGQPAWLMPEVDCMRHCYSLTGEYLSYLLTVGPDANDPNFVIN